MAYNRLTSIHGRRLALSSTGAIVDKNAYGALMKDSTGQIRSSSTALSFVGVMTLDGQNLNAQSAVAASVGSTFTNYGRQLLSSASATAMTAHEIAAPVAGILKEIEIRTSGTEFTLGGTATSIIFQPANNAAGSSLFISRVKLAGTTIRLRGISTTEWSVIGSTAGIVIG
jgi:hypothetical protein